MPLLQAESRSSLSVLKSSKRQLTNNMPLTEAAHDSGSSSAEFHSDSSQSVGKRRRSAAKYDISLIITSILQINWYIYIIR